MHNTVFFISFSAMRGVSLGDGLAADCMNSVVSVGLRWVNG